MSGLDELGRPRDPADLPHGRLGEAGRDRVEEVGLGAETGVVVEVGDGDRRVLLAQPRDQLGGGEAPASEREEVRVERADGCAEGVSPVMGQP